MEEKKIQVKLDKHMWPDEIEQHRKNRFKNVIVILLIVLTFFIGLLLGSLQDTKKVISNGSNAQFTRLEQLYKVMLEDWYFGKDIENLSDELINKAMQGMTSFEIDPNTSYMTKDEIQRFTQSIDMGFVGIGVQYTTVDGQFIVKRVFRDSPAEISGVQAGDIISKVNEVSVEGLTSDEVSKMVQGEEGSYVSIEFIRQGEPIVLEMKRATVQNTSFGYVREDGIGILEIYQFGSTTGVEVGRYLKDMQVAGVSKIIIDLRDNGGGYLNAIIDVASYFLPNETVVLKQEYRDGTTEINKTHEGYMNSFKDVVVLVNGSTASASEVLTAALKEQRNASVVGDVTYGKGTVQVPKMFSDGSSLKYTTAEWLTPNDEKIHHVGITPDYEIKLHPIFYEYILKLEEGNTIQYDSVSTETKVAQMSLDVLGYSVKRMDGYFDQSTVDMLRQFQSKMGLTVTGDLDSKTLEVLSTEVVREWNLNRENYDIQFDKAMELLK